jgi:hypothetical protein
MFKETSTMANYKPKSRDWKVVKTTLTNHGAVQWASLSEGSARVQHKPATRTEAEQILIESVIDGQLWRRIKTPTGWTQAQPIPTTPEFQHFQRYPHY